MKRLFPIVSSLLLATTLLAQDVTPADDTAINTGAGIMAGACGCIVPLIALAIQIAIAVWVYKDARKRGMDNAVLLTVLTVFTGLIGLLIYLLLRPKDVPPGPPVSGV